MYVKRWDDACKRAEILWENLWLWLYSICHLSLCIYLYHSFIRSFVVALASFTYSVVLKWKWNTPTTTLPTSFLCNCTQKRERENENENCEIFSNVFVRYIRLACSVIDHCTRKRDCWSTLKVTYCRLDAVNFCCL